MLSVHKLSISKSPFIFFPFRSLWKFAILSLRHLIYLIIIIYIYDPRQYVMYRVFRVNSWFIVLFEFKPLLPIRNRYYFRFCQYYNLPIVSLILYLVFEIPSYANDYFFYSFDVSYRFYYV